MFEKPSSILITVKTKASFFVRLADLIKAPWTYLFKGYVIFRDGGNMSRC